mgnify:CR=1 FL=1
MIEHHLTVANALVDLINGQVWTVPAVAVRRYVETLETLIQDQLRVFVFPGEFETDALSREITNEEHVTWFVVAVRVSDYEPGTVDPYVNFCRDLREALHVASLPDADVVGLDTDTIYDFDALNQRNQFIQVFGLKWRYDA